MPRPAKHTIFLPRESQQPEAQRAAGEALRIADWATPYLQRNGVELTVWKVRPTDLSNPRVLAAFQARGVGSLPALVVERSSSGPAVLVGCAAIGEYYRTYAGRDFAALEASAWPPTPGADAEEDPSFRIAARNRGRPYMGKRPGAGKSRHPGGISAGGRLESRSLSGDSDLGETEELRPSDMEGEDLLASFYENEAQAFQSGGAAKDYEFGTALS